MQEICESISPINILTDHAAEQDFHAIENSQRVCARELQWRRALVDYIHCNLMGERIHPLRGRPQL